MVPETPPPATDPWRAAPAPGASGSLSWKEGEEVEETQGSGHLNAPAIPLNLYRGHPGWTGRAWGGLLYLHGHICALGSQPGREIQPWSRWTRTDPSAQSHASHFVLTFC